MRLELPVHPAGRLYAALTWTIERRQCAEATRLQHTDHRRWLVDYFGDVPIGEVTFPAVDGYIRREQARGIANITIRKRLVTLRMALDDAFRRGLTTARTDWWPRLTGDTKPGQDLWTLEQYRQGRLAFEPGQRIGIDILWWTGMHLSDVLRWRRSDVDLAQGGWRRYNTKSKAEPRWLPLPDDFKAILEEWFLAEGISAPSHIVAPRFWRFPTKSMARICARAGVPRITPLGLRRNCISYQFELGSKKGMDPARVGQWSALWLGHKGDPQSSDIIRRHYHRWTPEAMKTASPY